MSLIFFDGFDGTESLPPDSAGSTGWISTHGGVSSIPGSGRRGGTCLTRNSDYSGAYRLLPGNYATLVAGIAFRQTSLAPLISAGILGFGDAATSQLAVVINTDMTLSVFRNSTQLAKDTLVLRVDEYYYIELKATIHGSTGSYELRVNTTTRLTATGVNTQHTANAYANTFHVGHYAPSGAFNARSANFDDVYLCDTAGGISDDFLGDCRIDRLLPNADGDASDFTVSGGANHYGNVDEAGYSAADYNYSTTVGHSDLYQMSNLPALPYDDVLGVKSIVSMLTDVAGTRAMASLMKTGSTVFEGATEYAFPTARHDTRMYALNPDTAAPWTQSEVNSLQFGATIKL